MREKGYLLSSYERVRVIVKRKSKEKREKAKETTRHVLLQNISQQTKEEENNNNNKYNENVCKSARCKKKRQDRKSVV